MSAAINVAPLSERLSQLLDKSFAGLVLTAIVVFYLMVLMVLLHSDNFHARARRRRKHARSSHRVAAKGTPNRSDSQVN